MSWLAKNRPVAAAPASMPSKYGKPGPAAAVTASGNVRASNALKEFMWLLSDVSQGRILDLGPAWQATITFFLDKGYRVSTEDLLHTWHDFIAAEDARMALLPLGERAKVPQSELAAKFLESALKYPTENFHGILAWDLLDYFDAEVAPPLIERLFSLLHPGGAMLSLFHTKPTQKFSRYRLVDSHSVEQLVSPIPAAHAHVFQNREIQDLFKQFRSSKTFIGRDQLREVLFLK